MMASHRHQRWRPVLTFLFAMSLARSSVSFVPPSAVTIAANRPVHATGMCGVTSASSRSRSRARLCLKRSFSASARRAAASSVENDDGVNGDDDDDFDQLVGIDKFWEEKAKRDREEADAEAAAAAAAAAAVAAAPPAAAAAPVGKGVDLGLDGAIFPSDAFPGSPGTEDITLQGVQLESGQPKAMVGFWKLYGRTADNEDLSARVILRADGQVVGGPAVRTTPGVEWSDPQGLQPVGGQWSVYSDERTGRARLRFTILLSFQKKQQLEMNGVVLMVDGVTGEMAGQEEERNKGKGRVLESEFGIGGKPLPQVFGSVYKRNGEVLEEGEGDFGMMKVPAGEDKLVATVGSQQKRIW